MKNIALSFSLFLLISFSPSIYAQNYYVCDRGGNDSHSGKSPAEPWATFDKVASGFRYNEAGDNISFCRGGTFTVTDYYALFNTNMTAANPIRFGDYTAAGTTNDVRPVIKSASGVFYFNTRNTSVPDGGLIIENFRLIGENGESRGIFLLNGVSDVTIDNVEIQNFHVGASIGNGSSESNNVKLINSVIANNHEQGWLGGGSNLLIEDNYFQNNGFGGDSTSYFYHNLYLSNSHGEIPAKNVVVRGNTLYQSAIFDGKCGGAPLVAHGRFDNLLIENNLIKEDKGKVSQYCYGLGVGPAYSKAEVFKNIVIKNNTLLNVGRVGISIGSMINGVIEGNTIIDEGSMLDVAILTPDTEDGAGDAKSQNVVVKNNTIIMNHQYSKGVAASGSYPVTVINNTISRMEGALADCIERKGASAGIDTSTNICSTHTSVNVDDLTDEASDAAAQQAAAQQAAAQQAAAQQAAAQQAAAQQAAAQATVDQSAISVVDSFAEAKRKASSLSLFLKQVNGSASASASASAASAVHLPCICTCFCRSGTPVALRR